MESPISASLGAMGSVLRKLDMLLLEPSEGHLRFHKGAKRWTHLLKDDLEEITSYLEDLSEVEDPPLTAKCWMKEVRELSYDIENYIDSFVLPGRVANSKTRSGRCRRRIKVRHIKITRLLETNKKLNRRKRVAARISDFRIDVREALERHKRYELHRSSSIRRGLLPAAERLPRTYEAGTGIIIDDRMRQFVDSMADERDPQLKVFSVVGPEGIGKTTLVKVLYHKLKGQFDCRAFIRLTRKPDIKTVLRDILTQVQQQPHNHYEDPDLLGKIREHLQCKRYLIVIEDLWSASIWDLISYAFPGGKMCSRIITSTQIEDLALACCYYHSEYVFKMRPLDEDLSRELFFNSLFCPENDFPQKLKDVLSKIVKICGGLPLATTVIASLLAARPVILMEQCTYIYDSLSSKLKTSSPASEGMKLVVNFSYNNLTCCLKTCLLYLSMYPEGYTVCKDDLVKQWVAEGFFDATEGREVETAESYFHELIGRRFLQPECIKYNGEVASCSVPEVVHDLIAQKSLEENFVVVLDHYRRNVSLSEKVHRLSLHFYHTKQALTNIRLSQVRSLTCFGLSKCMSSIREFKLLRVLNLNLSGYDDDDEDIIDLTWISELLQLRYLKVASDVCIELPKHMGGLQYLETVDISNQVTDVPSDIIHLRRLLHLHLPFEANLIDWLDMTGPAASMWSFGRPTDLLTNLQYLYLTCFIPVPDHLLRNILIILSSFRGLGSLKTLAFIISSAHKNAVFHGPSEETVDWDWDDFAPPLLERFEWLLHSCSLSRVPKWIGKLGNLCILKISVRELMSDGANILGELPALTTLFLYVKIPPVERIIFDKAGFSVLKYFKFKCSTVPWLKFQTDAMPNLQKLKLGFRAHSHRVDQQSTVPIIIEHLPGLQEISAKVADSSSDAESALTAAVSNHPRNPRIRMQLVDWNSYGHGVWYTVSKQENPFALEDKIPAPEEGRDGHCVPQYKDSRDDQNKKAYVSDDVPPRADVVNDLIKVRDGTATLRALLQQPDDQNTARARLEIDDMTSAMFALEDVSDAAMEVGRSSATEVDGARPQQSGSSYGNKRKQSSSRSKSQCPPVKKITGTLEDGFLWRKYGHKDIQDSPYPRVYYRCTHRHDQGCCASRQVQRCNTDPSKYVVAYYGEHTCRDPSTIPLIVDRAAHSEIDHASNSLISFGPSGTTSNNANAAASNIKITAGTLEDGYLWRKYGQKDIQDSPYPRSYYRCTHMRDQGCSATRQVQRCNTDPSKYVVTYRGEHTCRDPSTIPLIVDRAAHSEIDHASNSLISFGPSGTTSNNANAAASNSGGASSSSCITTSSGSSYGNQRKQSSSRRETTSQANSLVATWSILCSLQGDYFAGELTGRDVEEDAPAQSK